MKIRQAKKIMKQVYKTRYWAYRQGYYCGKTDAGKLAGDHRLFKGYASYTEVGNPQDAK